MKPKREGERVPDATFRARRDDEWIDVSSRDVFAGKRVVAFSLPGAFTPTCSSSHLPRYDELTPVFRAHGVDDVVCLSVNDAFVMDAWGRAQGARNVRLLPDGNGEFTRGMGMLVDKSELGFGPRSWRYSMLVDDGVIERIFVEPEVPGDPFEVSDADTMLAAVAPEAKVREVSIVTKPGCPHCARAKSALSERGLPYEEIRLGDGMSPHTLRAITGRSTVPQVFIDGRHVGGADELTTELENGFTS